MKKLPLKQIQHHDSTLLNMYRDFVVLDQEPVGEKQIKGRRKLASDFVDYIGNHISVLENQVDGKDEIDKFQYITDRILFWKNLLLHQFSVFYHSKNFTAPRFFDNESDKDDKPHNP